MKTRIWLGTFKTTEDAAMVKNRRRRFRYAADLEKRAEAKEHMRKLVTIYSSPNVAQIQSMASKFIVASFWVLLFLFPQLCRSISLSTDSRWIVDQQGRRVKLTYTNWVTHNEPMVGEGLEKKPVSYIVTMIRLTGFNCVRFTSPTYMFTRPEYGNLTVAGSLDRLSLQEAKAGFEINNPLFLNMTVVEAHKAAVDQLGLAGIMVVIDNHVSYPKWCCSNDDGNGFFGDEFFDPDEWVKGLTTVARRYHSHPAVIGMSLRNELRGNRQNPIDWYKFMAEGATAVHRESPNFLVIVSGLFFDTKLNFLQSNPLDIGNLNNKLVYEGHWYSFGYPQEQWANQTNSLCAKVSRNARDNFLFLTAGKNPFPVFLGEFGIDQRGVNERDNRYISCLLATVAEFDVDWALWTLQGSYIFRLNQSNMEETYGVMDFNWDKPRNPSFLARLQMIRQTNQGPGMKGPKNYRIFHPQTGLCVSVGRIVIFLGDCTHGSIWRQNSSEITLANTRLCLSAAEDGKVRVLSNCKTKWIQASSSKLQLAVDGGNLCLEGSGFRSGVVVNKCLCLDKNLADLEMCSENPQTQWFKLVPVQIMNRQTQWFTSSSFVGNRELCGKQTPCKSNVNGTTALSEATDSGQSQGKTKYSEKLLVSALATVLVALLCICGC